MRKRLIKTLAFCLSAAMLIGCISGCGTTGSSSGDSTQGSSSGRTDAVLCIDADLESTNPLLYMYKGEWLLTSAICDTLAEELSDGTFEPRLAKSWEVSEDGMTYTFDIRDDVTFHNGDKMTASDVAFTINESKTFPQNDANLINVETAEATDDTTLVVHMTEPYAPALDTLLTKFNVVPEDYYKEVGADAFSENPIGTGPFKYESRTTGVEVVFVRNDDYWREPPELEKITLKVITDTTTGAMALLNQEVDWMIMNSADVPTVEGNDAITVDTVPTDYLTYLILNPNTEPFNNEYVREAVAYALDRESMLDVCLDGYGEVNSVLCPKSITGYSDEVSPQYEYNLEKAKELMEQANVSTPIDAGDIICWSTTKPIAEMVQYSLSEIGIECDVQMYEFSTALETMDSGDFTLGTFRAGWGTDASQLNDIYVDGGVVNYAKLNIPEINDLAEKAKTATDESERQAYFTQLFSLVNEQCCYLNLYDTKFLIGHNSALTYEEAVNGDIDLYSLKWE